MMKFRAKQAGGRAIIGLGLEQANMERLTKGEPILFAGEQVGLPGIDITIFYGKDKEAMAAGLRAAGLILPPDADEKIKAAGKEPG